MNRHERRAARKQRSEAKEALRRRYPGREIRSVRWTGPNDAEGAAQFMAKLARKRAFRKGVVTITELQHDPDCPKVKVQGIEFLPGGKQLDVHDGECTCDPDVTAYFPAPAKGEEPLFAPSAERSPQ